jgi:paraquat-inducible protein A
MHGIIACHECDMLQQIGSLPEGGVVKCARCGSTLYHKKRNSLERTLAFAFAGLILLVLANSFPFLSIKIGSQMRETTLATGIHELYLEGDQAVAILVFITTILVPFVQVACMLYLLVPIKFGRIPLKLPQVLRFLRNLQPWSMMEVFMLGILVSMVKLAKMAKIVPGISLISFIALIFTTAAMIVSLDPHLIWEKWDKHR